MAKLSITKKSVKEPGIVLDIQGNVPILAIMTAQATNAIAERSSDVLRAVVLGVMTAMHGNDETKKAIEDMVAEIRETMETVDGIKEAMANVDEEE